MREWVFLELLSIWIWIWIYNYFKFYDLFIWFFQKETLKLQHYVCLKAHSSPHSPVPHLLKWFKTNLIIKHNKKIPKIFETTPVPMIKGMVISPPFSLLLIGVREKCEKVCLSESPILDPWFRGRSSAISCSISSLTRGY